MANSPFIQFDNASGPMSPSTIRKEWVLEGQPQARKRVIATSEDGTATMLIWDCTAGRFNWIYSVDESVYILEGSMVLKDPSGSTRVVNPGDTVFFPAGTQAEWTVDKYVRKVAFIRSTVPAPAVFAIRALRKVRRLISGNQQADMFG